MGYCHVENHPGTSSASCELGHQGRQGSISDSKEPPRPSTPPSLLSLPAMTQLAKPQSPTSPSLVTSIAAPIIPEADAGMVSSSTHPSPHVVANSPPLPCKSPPNSVEKLAQNSQPLACHLHISHISSQKPTYASGPTN